MGKLFESTNFWGDENDNIENLLDPFEGWRLPTKSEWENIITTDPSIREGSVVNGTQNAHWAFIGLSDATLGEISSPQGLLVFPDGKNISGKTLALNQIKVATSGITPTELNTYLEQGCCFIPALGSSYGGTWEDELYEEPEDVVIPGYYWSSTATGEFGYNLNFSVGDRMRITTEEMIIYYSVRLVKPVE